MRNILSSIRSQLPRHTILLVLMALGTYSYWIYRSNVAVFVGLFAAFATLVHELYGTKKGWWSYEKSFCMIFDRIPLYVLLTYFFMGMLMANYMLFRGV